MPESMAKKHERTRRKYNFYMDIRKKLTILLVIIGVVSILSSIIIAIKQTMAMAVLILVACSMAFILPLYIILQIWILLHRKVVRDFVDGV